MGTRCLTGGRCNGYEGLAGVRIHAEVMISMGGGCFNGGELRCCIAGVREASSLTYRWLQPAH